MGALDHVKRSRPEATGGGAFGGDSRAAAARPPLFDEPYCPPPPPWPPEAWPPERWQEWWASLARWCVYREHRLGEKVEELSPPPPLTAPEGDWLAWREALERWGFPLQPQEVDWGPFPECWETGTGETSRECRNCLQQYSAEFVRRCPHCKQWICRECLSLSRDACPVDGYGDPLRGARRNTTNGG